MRRFLVAALFLATTACNDSTGPELSAAVSSNPDTPLVTAPLNSWWLRCSWQPQLVTTAPGLS